MNETGLRRSVSARTALSGGHRKPVEIKKTRTKDIFSIPYTRCVYQTGEYENACTPKLFPELSESDNIGRILIYTFGKDRYGGLGHGPDVTQVDKPTLIEALEFILVSKIFSGFGQGAAVTDSGKLYVWGNGKFSPMLTELPNAFLRVVQVALGSSHVAVRVQSGDVYTWGSNLVGQLGLGTTVESVAHPCKVPNLPPVADIKASYVHLLALTTKKELYLWGRNILTLEGESIPILYVGQPEYIRAPFKVQFGGSGNIAQIACGHEFNVVLTEEGKVWTWGRAKCGCLGNDSEEDHRSIPMIVKALEHVKIEHVSCGIRHTAAWNSSGEIYTWGYGEKGNLGHGDTENQLVPKFLQGLPVTQFNTPSDGVKTVVCSLSQTFIIWERYAPIEQAMRYLVSNGLDQEGLFKTNPPVSEIAEIQAKIESGTFVEFPPNAAHLVAGFLLRLLKTLPSSLLPHAIVELMMKMDGVLDKPMRNLRVLTAMCDSTNALSPRTRGVIAQFLRILVELSLRPAAKMSLPNIATCVGSCFFTNMAESQGFDGHKEAAVIHECMFLLLQNAPVFYDYMFFELLQLSNFVDFVDAPKLLEALSLHNLDPQVREDVISCIEYPWASFEPGSIFVLKDRNAGKSEADINYVVPFMSGIPSAQRRSMTVNVLVHLDRIAAELRAEASQAEKVNAAIVALQQCARGIELLLAELAKPPKKAQVDVSSNSAVNDAALIGLLETSVTAREPTISRPTDTLAFIGSGGLDDIMLRRRSEALALAKDHLERELLQVMRELQSTSTQVTSQQRKRDEEAAELLCSLRQHVSDTRALYLLKGSEYIGNVLEHVTLPPFYLTGEQAPPIRTRSVLSEVFVSVLEYVQYEWETTVTALHASPTNDTWGRVLEVYGWWKGLCNIFSWLDGIGGNLSSGIEACKEYISPSIIEKHDISIKHIRYVFEETARYIKTTQHSSKTGDYLYEILEQRSPKT